MRTYRVLTCMLAACAILFSCKPEEKPGPAPDPKPTPDPDPVTATVTISDIAADSDAIKYDSSNDKLTINFTDTEGSISFKLTASDTWTVKATNDRADSWLSVSPASGNKGETTVKFSAKANDTYDERSADFDITCGSVKKSVRVVQKQKDAILISDTKAEVSAEGGYLNIELQHNIDYKVEISEGADWIKRMDTKGLSEVTLSFKVDPNEGTKAREGKISVISDAGSETVTVYQAGAVPYIVVGQKEYNVDSDAHQIEILVTSNTAVSISIEGSEWLQHDQTKAVSTDRYVFNVSENTDYDSRTGKIVFHADNGMQEDVVINQSALGALIIAADKYEVPCEGGDYSFELATNIEYTVTTSSPWIHILETKGLSRHDIRFSVDENTDISDRQGKIVVSSGSKTQEILISQAGLVPHIVISQKEFNVDSDEHQIEVFVTRNTPVSYRIEGADWIASVQTKASTTDRYMFSVRQNTDYDSRTGKIVFFTDNGMQEDVVINQSALGALIIAADKYEVPCEGGDYSFELATNIEYTVTTSSPWIHILETKGLSRLDIRFSVDENTSSEQRYGTIGIHAGDKTQEVTVIQERAADRTGILQRLEKYTTLSRDKITAVNFYTGSDKTTSMYTDVGGPIYGETVGTTVNIYTKDEKFLVDLDPFILCDYYVTWELKGYFEDCISLKTLDLRTWDTSISFSISSLFKSCTSLESVDLSSFDTRNVTNMTSVFFNCNNLSNIDLSSFETPNLMLADLMFGNSLLNASPKLKSLDLSNFDTSNLICTEYMLQFQTNLEELNLSGWKGKSLENAHAMLLGAGTKASGGLNVYCDQDLAEILIRQSYAEASCVRWIVPGGFKPYESSDYSRDGKVTMLNNASVGNGVNIFIFGDGFADKDIADGSYETIARKVMEGIFSEEPFKSCREMFNVYLVDKVSRNNLFMEGTATVFSANPSINTSGGLSFDSQKVEDEVRKIAGDANVDKSTAILIVNDYANAGAAYIWNNGEIDMVADYAGGFGVAGACLDYLESTILHEIGHAFAKLDEEYVTEYDLIPTALKIQKTEEQNSKGWWTNIDFTNDLTKIRWADYVSDSRYAAQNIGAYEGAGQYLTGVWRPTENSFMNMNWGGYNAPSRETIYRRIHKLAYGANWEFDRETFKQWDTQKTKSSVRTTTNQADNQRPVRRTEKDYHIIR